MSTGLVRPFILPSSESQEDVGIKEDVKKLQGQMGTVLGMLGKANLAGKPHSGLEVPGAAPRSRKLDQIWIRGLPIVAIIVAIVAWLEPRYRLHREQDLKNAIKIEVEDQLREPLGQLENMRVQIGEIQG